MGNTLPGAQGLVPLNITHLARSADGRFFSNAPWEEAGWNCTKPESFPWPAEITEFCRMFYDSASDTMYLGYSTAAKKAASWGTMGSLLSRYDGWRSGKPILRWTIETPLDDTQLQPKCFSAAGDYVFLAPVKATQGMHGCVIVLAAKTGDVVGQMRPDSAGGLQWPIANGASEWKMGLGWIDMANAINSMRRANGEYLVLLEEDFRGKNLLYRWVSDTRTAVKQ